jgi:drug/metabolite transporter (DMT)-like permease
VSDDATVVPHDPRRARRAIAWACGSIFFFTTMMALVKWVSGNYATIQVGFFRATFAMLTAMPLVLVSQGLRGFKPVQPGGFVLRGAVGVAATLLCYHGVTLMPLADWVALTFTVPFFVALLSAPVLGEHVSLSRWAAIGVGFLGVLVIVPPTGGASLYAISVGLAGQALIAWSIVLMRALGRRDGTTTIVFYYMVGISVGMSLLVPFVWTTPDLRGFIELAMVGVLAGFAHLLLTTAYRMAPAAMLAPFDYTGAFWALIIGYLVWNEIPGVNFFVGAALVIGSGLYVLLRETARG